MSDESDKTHAELRAIRDTVESIWVAIVLAFVLRAFMVEAFVIPTGSMAPRLMGEHWDLTCPECHYRYAYGMSGRQAEGEEIPRDDRMPPVGAVCPLCGAPYTEKMFVNGGDRVLVLKYLYRFREPQPWDVVVFRNPQNNQENYIKRLIGLPGESIMVMFGDVFVKSSHDAKWRIRRKTERAQRAMWQLIHSIDYPPSQRYLNAGNAVPVWKRQDTDRWDLGTPSRRQWKFLGSGEWSELELDATKGQRSYPGDSATADEARRRVFLPHYAYNRSAVENDAIDPQTDVCRDLRLSAVVFPGEQATKVRLDLTSFEHRFRAEIDTSGKVSLRHQTKSKSEKDWAEDGGQEWGQADIPPMQVGKGHCVALVHVDYQVQVWIDGTCVLASTNEQYAPDFDALRERVRDGYGLAGEAGRHKWAPTPVPQVRIASRGGACRLRHVALQRDVYYTSAYLEGAPPGPLGDYARRLQNDPRFKGRNHWHEVKVEDRVTGQILPRDIGWAVAPYPLTLAKHGSEPNDLDEFFVLGDNSPQSLDGRAWVKAAPSLRLVDADGKPQYQLGTVPRYNLIGKAFFVYWPSGFRVPGLAFLPVIPNVGKMRMIR